MAATGRGPPIAVRAEAVAKWGVVLYNTPHLYSTEHQQNGNNMEENQAERPTMKMLPGDEVRQIMWRYAERLSLIHI